MIMFDMNIGSSFITSSKYDGRLNGLDAMIMQTEKDKEKEFCEWRSSWGDMYEPGCRSARVIKTNPTICPYCGRKIKWREF